MGFKYEHDETLSWNSENDANVEFDKLFKFENDNDDNDVIGDADTGDLRNFELAGIFGWKSACKQNKMINIPI